MDIFTNIACEPHLSPNLQLICKKHMTSKSNRSATVLVGIHPSAYVSLAVVPKNPNKIDGPENYFT